MSKTVSMDAFERIRQLEVELARLRQRTTIVYGHDFTNDSARQRQLRAQAIVKGLR